VPNPAAHKLLPPDEVLFGASGAAKELAGKLAAVSASDLPVVLRGEPGTGKELIARWIHLRSPFAEGNFVKAACVSLEDEDACRLSLNDEPLTPGRGLLEQLRELRTGTLFLDDVENLALTTQALLSRLFAEGDAGTPAAGGIVRFRVISATRHDLRVEAAQRHLRPDFFHSISAFTARLTPLRDRIGELPRLAQYFVERHGQEFGVERAPVSASSLEVFRQYAWPGNFRELENMLVSYVLTGNEDLLVERVRALARTGEENEAGAGRVLAWPSEDEHADLPHHAPKIEDEVLLRALRENRWNRRQTATRLQMSYRSLLNRLKKIDMNAGRQPVLRSSTH
jgi:DNA-binding NtrC family response regulator